MEEILIVEDQIETYELLIKYLTRAGYRVYHRDNGKEALVYIKQRSFKTSLIILDVMLPGMKGTELLMEIRKLDLEIPVLMLTSVGDTESIVESLQRGADDYLVKPFSLPELHARIKALLRRPGFYKENIIKIGEFELNVDSKQAKYKEKILKLRRKEYDLLQFFLTYPNQTLSRDQILMNVWDMDTIPNPNSVDVHVRKLRVKLMDEGKDLLETIHSFGYRLNVKREKRNAQSA